MAKTKTKNRTVSNRKNPASQSKEKSLHVWFVSFSLYLFQIHTRTNHKHSEQFVCLFFFECVDCLLLHNQCGLFSQVAHCQAARHLDRLESKLSTGEAVAWKATRSVESTVRVCDCHWHWVKMVHSHVCAEKWQWVWRCLGAVEETESQVHHDLARPVGLP